MSCERMKLQRMIQALEFTALDLNLFLDTHPHDERALRDYNDTHRKMMKLKRMYEERYGPLLNYGFSPSEGNRWRWIDEPWPWETEHSSRRRS